MGRTKCAPHGPSCLLRYGTVAAVENLHFLLKNRSFPLNDLHFGTQTQISTGRLQKFSATATARGPLLWMRCDVYFILFKMTNFVFKVMVWIMNDDFALNVKY